MKLLLLLGALCALPALAAPPQLKNGTIVDHEGMTLYFFDKDTMPGHSACTGMCASRWPMAQAAAGDRANGPWNIITHPDGKRQWAYQGRPLYRWTMDHKAGDASGDGMGGMWHAARP